jgi:allantoinase
VSSVVESLIIRSTRIVLPEGVAPASIHIEHGRITHVGAYDDRSASAGRFDAIDVGDLAVSPGIVDTHVHVNEPGRTEWEGFDTATRAAAAGGVTTIVDMPLNSIPATTTVDALDAKRDAARGHVHVDVAFWGGVVPGNTGELDALVDAGVRGFKCFLVPSGVDEFPHVGESDLRQALPILARRGVPLLVHAESPQIIAECGLRSADLLSIQSETGPDSAIADSSSIQSSINPHSAILNPQYALYLASRPPKAEVEAIRLMIRLAREFNARVHIVHVACEEAAAEIAHAKGEGVAITAETCPHYLTFAAEEIRDGATEFKCAPPIREAHHRDALWTALADGVLDLVATDHSPAPPSMKCPGDFMRAWGGVASLELSLSAVWTFARLKPSRDEDQSSVPSHEASKTDVARRLQPSVADLARWMSVAPAMLCGLSDRKGRIAEGYDADLVVWDPDAEFIVNPSRLHQRHPLTPYAGRTLRGVVRATILGGARVWDGERLIDERAGRLL